MGGPHGCHRARGASTRHAEKMGIHIDKWTLDPQHRPARPTRSVGRVCHRPRVGPSPRPKSRQGVQKLHVRLPPRLGGTAASPTNLTGGLEMDVHSSTLPFHLLLLHKKTSFRYSLISPQKVNLDQHICVLKIN